MMDEGTEAEALSDWIEAMGGLDDSCLEDSYEERDYAKRISREKTIARYKTRYDANKKAKVGELIVCPVCSKKFTKKSYQQVFCGIGKIKHKCKDTYWNSVDVGRMNRAEMYNPNS